MPEIANELIKRQFENNKDAIRKGLPSFILIGIIGVVIGCVLTSLLYEKLIIKGKETTIEQLQGRQDSVKVIVFDEDGTIHTNIGAKGLIEELKVERFKSGKPCDFMVTLRTKEHLQHIPIVQSISGDAMVVWEATRTDEKTIVWKGGYSSVIMFESRFTGKFVFKMEIYQTR